MKQAILLAALALASGPCHGISGEVQTLLMR